jgi:hypothetical protein
MTNTQTTKANHYFRALVALAVLTMTASLLAVMAVRPASASTTFTVNYPYDTSDATSADGLCDVATFIPGEQCTLRAAIQQANATQGADAIHFDIPDSYGAGVKTIHVGATTPSNGELPSITDTVTIDGYTQPGSSVNTLAKGTNAKPMIQLDGSKVTGEWPGLYIKAPGVVVKGLVINRFMGGGMLMTDGANNSRIEGNFIGTDPSGTLDRGNLDGGMAIWKSSNVTVGGSSPAARNLISGNGKDNTDHGVSIGGNFNEVSGNLIGTQSNGESPLGNSGHGVAIVSTTYDWAPDNSVGGTAPGYANTIAFNGGDGVAIFYAQIGSLTASDNHVLSNSIFSNKGLGIDLADNGPTPNDAGDADAGPNFQQNYPLLSSAKKSTAGKTTIKGKLNSTPNQYFTVQFFSNPKGTDEGKKLLFSKSISTNGSGNVSFAFSTKKKVTLGQNITATATDPAVNTSEFSAPKKVVAS